MMESRTTVVIEETTVEQVSGQSVAAANPCIGDFELADGTSQNGPSILLCFLADESTVRVGAGSRVAVGGTTWSIEEVDVNLNGLGHVRMVSEQAPNRTPASPASLDFIFRDSCCFCGGRTGWDGTTSEASGRLEVGMACIRCPSTEWMTGGRVQRMFFDDPPTFTPGRSE
jgi:hypothetical protein